MQPAKVLIDQPSQVDTTKPAIIEANEVEKTYNTGDLTVPALRGIDLHARKGEIVAIMGPSGCGKTTLLNCLSGLDIIDSGTIRLDGINLAQLSDEERTEFRARHMGFVFQFYNLLPVLNAVENVELPLLISDVSPKQARQRALASLKQVGLGDRARHRPAELSGGQRQRLTIARALVNEPAIVWADEPTGDLDSETADDVMQLIHRMNRENEQTFVVVTHDPGIGRQCHRTIEMQDGQIIDDGHSHEKLGSMTLIDGASDG